MTDTFTFNLTTAFDQPYRTETAAPTTQVPPPAPFQVSIGAHAYPIDTEFKPYLRDAFRHRSIASQRQAIDLTNEPGEGTVNTEDLWRRGQENWTLGAGQPYLDRKKSSPTRFWNSEGITTALTWQLSLLPKAVNVYETTEPNVDVIAVGDTVFVADGTVVKRSTNLVTWTTVIGAPGTPLRSWATNGTTLWLAYGAAGIYVVARGADSMSVYAHSATKPVTMVGWAGTYLLAGSGPSIYGGGGTYAIYGETRPATYKPAYPAMPDTPLWTHPNPTWRWVHSSWGDSEVYLAGYVDVEGGSGAIYRTTTTTTGLNLLVPTLALPLEGGERAHCIFAYLNYEFVGTNLGVRMCRTISAYDPSGNAGDLEAGALQPNLFQKVTTPVYAICAHNRFVYFAWTKFNAWTPTGEAHSGLGRLDLANFVDALTPAYVSDLMTTSTGVVQGCAWLTWPTTPNGALSSPIVAISGSGLWVNSRTELVTKGWVDSGYITYGIPDAKVALQLSAKAQQPLDGSLSGYVSGDARLGSRYGQVGERFPTTPSAKPWPLTQIRAELFQVRIQMKPTGTKSPILNRWLLKSYPAVVSGTTIIAPITLARTIVEQGLYRPFDPYAELAYLQALRQSQQVVKYVEGPFTATVIITTLDWIPYAEQGNAGDRRGYNGTLVVYMKSFPTTNA